MPVLMVHGWGGSHQRTWQEPGVEMLLQESGRRVIGIDLLGHGTADKPHDPAAYADLSLPIRTAASDACVDGRVDGIGFSLGAIALLHAASINPNLFRRLILAGIGDSVFEPQNESETARIISGVDGTASDHDTIARQFGAYARQTHNDSDALRAVLQRPRGEPFTELMANTITAQVLVVVGDGDFVLPADRLAASFGNSRLQVLQNCDLFATPENFSFIDALLDFFA